MNSRSTFSEDEVFSKRVAFEKRNKYYFNQKSETYAMVREDNSILLFRSIYDGDVELLCKDKAAIDKSSINELKKIASKEREDMEAIKKRTQSENFYKKGNVVASVKNPGMEAEFMKILKRENDMPFVTKEEKVAYKEVRLISVNWQVVKSKTGIPLKQIYAAWVIGNYVEGKDKTCFYQEVHIKKEYLGGGQYGEPVYDKSWPRDYISCDLLKK